MGLGLHVHEAQLLQHHDVDEYFGICCEELDEFSVGYVMGTLLEVRCTLFRCILI